MAQRRMFSPEIVGSEEFMTMPTSSQALYFHLGMEADDDGFVQPKLLMRAIGFNDDDLKVLLAKRFLLEFGNGVVVIKHWLIHNMIRADRYKPTRYSQEKSSLLIKNNNAYTERQPDGNQMAPQVRLGKVRLGKVSSAAKTKKKVKQSKSSEQSSEGKKEPEKLSAMGADVVKQFEAVNPAAAKWYNRRPMREAADRLIEQYGFEIVSKVIKLLPQTNGMPYMPTITNPIQLEDKWAALESGLRKKKGEQISKGRGLA